MISIQTEDFDVGNEYQLLRNEATSDGAVVTFTGLVRDYNAEGKVTGMFLEHYPEMTEKALEKIVLSARERWNIGATRIIHRIGKLHSEDQIVFVGVTSRHRQSAFDAANFIMDYLKTSAPFWKQEMVPDGAKWVAAKDSDKLAAKRWQLP